MTTIEEIIGSDPKMRERVRKADAAYRKEHGEDQPGAGKGNGEAKAQGVPIILTGGPLDHARKLVGLEFTYPEGRGLHRHRGGFHEWTGTHYFSRVRLDDLGT